MGLTLQIRKGVPADVRSAVHSFTRFVREHIEIPHRLTVIVESEPVVCRNGTDYGFGLFCYSQRCHRPQIILAGGLPRLIEGYEGNGAEAMQATLETYAHEIGHYEQFRDGRKIQERGVAVRARNLVKQYHLWQGE